MSKEAGINQKLKLLYLVKIFNEETDENHMLTVYELSDMLEKCGVFANRKTLAEDIALLIDFGMDIIIEKTGRTNYYYLGQREFEIPELKLLADAVSSSRFITEKKSRQLLKKLEVLAGRFHGREINRRVYIANRIKSENEQIYINVDTIQRAIDSGKMIKFDYFDYTVDKKKKVRDGDHICSPYALTWDDGNYYLVAHYLKYPDSLVNFRVDRMAGVKALENDAAPIPKNFDLAGYMNTTFSMFSGTEYDIKLRFKNRLMNAVADRFGTDIIIIPDGDDHFVINVKIKAGSAFYGWLFQFGKGAQILYPEKIRAEYRSMIAEVMEMYE